MHYMTGREDLDARRFCRQQFNPPEGHRATIVIQVHCRQRKGHFVGEDG